MQVYAGYDYLDVGRAEIGNVISGIDHVSITFIVKDAILDQWKHAAYIQPD